MARPRSAGYDDQLEQILAAAARLFATRGYTATTMNDVAAACGVSKATLYHYVRDKHELLAHITAGHVARLEALVRDVAAQPLAPGGPAARTHPPLHAGLCRCAGRAPRADRGREVPATTPSASACSTAQRRVVAALADAVAALRPDLGAAQLHKPLAHAAVRHDQLDLHLAACRRRR